MPSSLSLRCELLEAPDRFRKASPLPRPLGQQSLCFLDRTDGLVDFWVRALPVGPNRDEILGVVVGGEHAPYLLSRILVLGRYDPVHQPRNRRADVDRWMAAAGNRARQDDVTVEQAAQRIGDGIVHVVAVDEHREKAGDASLLRPPQALHEARNRAEE